MNVLHAALLGVVQGLTEFLPVSSSAHLILARMFFGWDTEQFGLAFDVACHVGTLLAVAAYFRRELDVLARAVPDMARRPWTEPARQLWLIGAGTIPIVLVGLAFTDVIEVRLRTPAVAAMALGIGAGALMVAERVGSRSRTEASVTIPEAVALGFAQAAALVPGVSRSGATIALAVLLGLRRDAAARFTFLLGIPAIVAAAAHAGLDLVGRPLDVRVLSLFAVGIVTSAAVGYVTVKYFIRYVAGHSLDPFAWYRLALAACAGLWLVSR